ncbi:GNAT family N-acetyltransferase [uncultured Ferrovibrio sp.]|jgi:L-amino acid N-acyltransferase YncA|uniref:GNAT family N-acetyltransferase n=1 Tax=uncultured Ferrovibrio sp. TaxID=1576913 RepID=UPI0026225134|nr:GNAT family N-acetyltransferase [uncultured Ferrovibrio sp.]
MTNQPTLIVRPSHESDIPAIAAIYGHHVLHGSASFEEVPPDAAEMARRRSEILAKGLPYLTAELDGKVVGYAYAGPYRTRIAYRFTLEDSIYVAPDAPRRGIGRALLSDLIARCAALGYRQMVAVIGDTCNTPSIGLHAALGFRVVGTLPSVGFKHGRWVDSVFMQRPLGPGDATLPGELVTPQAR